MKRSLLTIPLAGALFLTGCSGLTESGSELNSKVPKEIGDYKVITAEDASQTGFCEGATSKEVVVNDRGYFGHFLYVKDGFKLPETPGLCYDRDWDDDTLIDGVVAFEIWNYPAIFDEGLCEEHYNEDRREVIKCKFDVDEHTVYAQGILSGSKVEFEAELKELSEEFLKKADLKTP